MPKSGLIDGKKVSVFIGNDIKKISIEDLPFRAVSTDLNTGDEVAIRDGDIIEAVRASISVPGIFTPVKKNGTILVDVGIIMLMGIVVKNAIVLVDYTKQLKKRGMNLHDAIVNGGRTRLRPILMTSLTTIFGMTPPGHFQWGRVGNLERAWHYGNQRASNQQYCHISPYTACLFCCSWIQTKVQRGKYIENGEALTFYEFVKSDWWSILI